ncbi:hypothetical protein [Prevotella intermedia]|uniref:hypothetical protein n=1 Tax=Prevotella intermedia TaxID=28131 RepID=UPI0011C0764D|nr:hypothetical protein [Prevotella intermedia]
MQISRSILIANGYKFHFKTLRNTGKCPFSKQTILFHLQKGGDWGLRPPRRQHWSSPCRQSFLTTTMRESPKRLHE